MAFCCSDYAICSRIEALNLLFMHIKAIKKAHHNVMSWKLVLYMRPLSDLYSSEWILVYLKYTESNLRRLIMSPGTMKNPNLKKSRLKKSRLKKSYFFQCSSHFIIRIFCYLTNVHNSYIIRTSSNFGTLKQLILNTWRSS